MIAMIDNYDSFTYNLVQYLAQLGGRVAVIRNDAATVADIAARNPAGIVISPGPGGPATAGISVPVIRHFSGRIPILGVCLGHQSIAFAFGAQIIAAQRLMHGKTSTVSGDGRHLYQGIKRPFQAMRYHSLAVARKDLPACLEITSASEDGEIMGIRHREHPTEGIQFHPESIMTPLGKRMLRNFLNTTQDGPTVRERPEK